jgi:hypothetical protein
MRIDQPMLTAADFAYLKDAPAELGSGVTAPVADATVEAPVTA